MMSILVIVGEALFALLFVLVIINWGRAVFVGARGLIGLLGRTRKGDQSPRILAETSGLDYQERGSSSVAHWIEHSSPADGDSATEEIEIFDVISQRHRGYPFEIFRYRPAETGAVRVQVVELPQSLPAIGARSKGDAEIVAANERFASALLTEAFVRAAARLDSKHWRITDNRLFCWQETSSYHTIPKLKNIGHLVDMAQSISTEVWELYGDSRAPEG